MVTFSGGPMTAQHDISGLMAFVNRDEDWQERLELVTARHLGPAILEYQLTYDEACDLLGDDWSDVIRAFALADFLSTRYDDGNIVDLYLKRHGWRETGRNRAWLTGLRDSQLSLFEVSDVRPGVSMVLRDLVTGAEPITVHEQTATRTLRQWDRIAVRVLPEGDHHVITGAQLDFDSMAVHGLFLELRHALKLKEHAKIRISRKKLQRHAPLFSTAWLLAEIDHAANEAPLGYINSDGDEILFHDMLFPLQNGVTQEAVVGRLDGVTGFHRAGPDFWHWAAPPEDRGSKADDSISLDIRIEGGVILGALELKDEMLFVTANSSRRAQEVEALVMAAAGDLLRPPVTETHTVEEAEADDDALDEIESEAMHVYLDQHYRETLDRPLPALGDKSPREAIRTAAGREQVVEWLKALENRTASMGDDPVAIYDFGWMWVELGLEGQRK